MQATVVVVSQPPFMYRIPENMSYYNFWLYEVGGGGPQDYSPIPTLYWAYLDLDLTELRLANFPQYIIELQ